MILDKAKETNRKRAKHLERPHLLWLRERFKVHTNRFMSADLHPKQRLFLSLNHREGLFGGAAGGGKSAALLNAALQYVDLPNYHSLIVRRTFSQLNRPGALIDMSKEWLRGTGAKWREIDKTWRFPETDSILQFGHIQHEKNVEDYQGSEWHFCGYDELTQFPERYYTYLFSRLRRRKKSKYPVRFRAASNPGGVGHEWVKTRFVTHRTEDRFFLPSKLHDNPSLDAEDYIKSLMELDEITRLQLLAGDWDAYRGGRFREEWFLTFELKETISGVKCYALQTRFGEKVYPIHECTHVVVCDPACSEKETADYTAILTAAITPDGDVMVIDVINDHLDIDQIPGVIAENAEAVQASWVGVEGSNFQMAIVRACRKHPKIPTVIALKHESKSKLVRATPAMIRAEQGEIYLPPKSAAFPWVKEFIGQLLVFTGDDKLDAFDDMVDALAYLILVLDRHGWLRTLSITDFPMQSDSLYHMLGRYKDGDDTEYAEMTDDTEHTEGFQDYSEQHEYENFFDVGPRHSEAAKTLWGQQR